MNLSLEELIEMLDSDSWENYKLPDMDLYQLWHNSLKREFWIETEINWSTVSRMYKWIQSFDVKDQTPIKIHFMSPGGELIPMFACFHLLKSTPIPVHTYNHGGCHSAAFIMFLAGDKRDMTPYATFIAHEGSGAVGGSFRETKAAMKQYEIDVERMCHIIEKETNLELGYIKKRFSEDQDWYIGYEEAKKIGVLKD